jgi:hypothetical protein
MPATVTLRLSPCELVDLATPRREQVLIQPVLHWEI